MAKNEPAALVADSHVTEYVTPTTTPATPTKAERIDQEIDAWLVSVANDGTGHALRLASSQADRLKVAIHTILEEI